MILILQALVNKSINMVKQLYYSEIHSKSMSKFILAGIMKFTM